MEHNIVADFEMLSPKWCWCQCSTVGKFVRGGLKVRIYLLSAVQVTTIRNQVVKCSLPLKIFLTFFKLEVDADAVGAIAVLLQDNTNGIDHRIRYFYSKFNKHS